MREPNYARRWLYQYVFGFMLGGFAGMRFGGPGRHEQRQFSDWFIAFHNFAHYRSLWAVAAGSALVFGGLTSIRIRMERRKTGAPIFHPPPTRLLVCSIVSIVAGAGLAFAGVKAYLQF
jgi:hypothetical protein